MTSFRHKFDQFLNTIFETDGPDGVVECFDFLFGAFVITKNGLVIGANAEFLAMSEYDRTELYGMSALALITEDERAAMVDRFARKNTDRYELKMLTKSKKIKNVLVSPKIFSAGGEPYRLAEFIDVTVQKQKELIIKENEEKFHSVFEQAAVGIARVSLDGFFLEVNHKFCDIVGYDKKELEKKTYKQISHPDDLEKDSKLVKEMLRNERHTYHMEKRYYHKNGRIIWVNLTVSLARSTTREPKYYIAVIEDINQRKQIEQKLILQATHDSLTGLNNRSALNKALAKELQRAIRYQRSLSLMMIDIDHFKRVNDDFGHQQGDKVLMELAEIFNELTRANDIVGRFGGEEFLLILPEIDYNQAAPLAERIRETIESYEINNHKGVIKVTVSIGIASYPAHGNEAEKLIMASDNAMYEAKKRGRNQIVSAG